MKKRICLAALVFALLLGSLPVTAGAAAWGAELFQTPQGPSNTVLPNSLASPSALRQQIQYIYQAAKRGAGTSTFKGYCAWYVNWQLYLLGINREFVGGNGNQEFDNYCDLTRSNGGYNITAYPAKSYSLRGALNAITESGTRDAYNILVGFQVGSGADGLKYGHTCFIHGIVDGQVYYSESFAATVDGVKHPEGAPIVCSIDTFCDYYTWAVLDGVILFTNPAAHVHDKGTFLFQDTGHPHSPCYQCSLCGEIWQDTAVTQYVSSCRDCNLPETPAMNPMEPAYLLGTEISFSWEPVKNATRYVLYLYRLDENGNYPLYERIDNAFSGMTRSLPVGAYRVQVQAVNDGYTGVETLAAASPSLSFDVVQSWICEKYGHRWTEAAVAEPTCTAGGLRSLLCRDCGETLGEYLSPLGHSYGTATYPLLPTLEEDGCKETVCTRCGDRVLQTLPATGRNPFVDVIYTKFYYAPVVWAYETGVSNGVDVTHFLPGGACTRGQVVTFLWRAMGSPEPSETGCLFQDLTPGRYDYKAALWANETGIAMGVDETHFAPDQTVTRGQFVTFLYRAMGQPEPGEGSPMVDLTPGRYYYSAVLWAWAQGIAGGMDATHFAPEAPCTRGQVVTFLHRAFGEA